MSDVLTHTFTFPKPIAFKDKNPYIHAPCSIQRCRKSAKGDCRNGISNIITVAVLSFDGQKKPTPGNPIVQRTRGRNADQNQCLPFLYYHVSGSALESARKNSL